MISDQICGDAGINGNAEQKTVIVGDKTVRGFERLSDREVQVLRLLGDGKESREIAGELRISSKTVQVFREHIKKKLGLKNAVQLICAAARWTDL